MVAFFAAQVDLILQVSIFVFLTVGLLFERKRKIKTHARLMLAAVVLNLISFFAFMAPAWDIVGEAEQVAYRLLACCMWRLAV